MHRENNMSIELIIKVKVKIATDYMMRFKALAKIYSI